MQSISGLYSRVEQWAKAPFNNDMGLLDLALTVLFVTVLVFLYWSGMRYITESGDITP